MKEKKETDSKGLPVIFDAIAPEKSPAHKILQEQGKLSQLNQESQSQQIKFTGESWLAPLPPPKALKQYEQIQPGAADRIIRMAEKHVEMAETQGNHRIKLEGTIIEIEGRNTARGQHYGLIVAIVGFGVAWYALYCDHPWAASTICGVTLASIVGAFLYGKHQKKSDAEKPVMAPEENGDHPTG